MNLEMFAMFSLGLGSGMVLMTSVIVLISLIELKRGRKND